MAWLLAAAIVAAIVGSAWQRLDDKWSERGKYLLTCSATAIGVGLALWADRFEVERRERDQLQALFTDLYVTAQNLGTGINWTLQDTGKSEPNCALLEQLRVDREMLNKTKWDRPEAAKHTSQLLRQSLRMTFLELHGWGAQVEQDCKEGKPLQSIGLRFYQAYAAKLTFKLGLAVASLDATNPLDRKKLFRCLAALHVPFRFALVNSVKEIAFESECCEEFLRASASAAEKWAGTSDPTFFREIRMPLPESLISLIDECPSARQVSPVIPCTE